MPPTGLGNVLPKNAKDVPLIVWIHGGRRTRQYFGAGGGCELYADPAGASMVKAFFATHLVG